MMTTFTTPTELDPAVRPGVHLDMHGALEDASTQAQPAGREEPPDHERYLDELARIDADRALLDELEWCSGLGIEHLIVSLLLDRDHPGEWTRAELERGAARGGRARGDRRRVGAAAGGRGGGPRRRACAPLAVRALPERHRDHRPVTHPCPVACVARLSDHARRPGALADAAATVRRRRPRARLAPSTRPPRRAAPERSTCTLCQAMHAQQRLTVLRPRCARLSPAPSNAHSLAPSQPSPAALSPPPPGHPAARLRFAPPHGTQLHLKVRFVLLFWLQDALDRQDRAGSAPLLRAAGRAGPGRLLLRSRRGAGRVGRRRRAGARPRGPGGAPSSSTR